jgi:hypothetical protein
VFESDDVVFAWAIGKALMIVIVSFSTLVYLAWAVTWKRENAAHVGIPKDGALKQQGVSLTRARSYSLQTEQLKK